MKWQVTDGTTIVPCRSQDAAARTAAALNEHTRGKWRVERVEVVK